MNSKNNNLIYISLLVLVIGVVVFAGYYFLKPKNNAVPEQASTNNINNSNQNGGFADRRGQSGGTRGNFQPPLHGTISSVDTNAGTIVMKADDGSSKNITISSATRISEITDGQPQQLALADLTFGNEINVMASDTSTSPIQARMIIIGTFTRPQGGSDWNGGPPDNSGSPDGINPSI